MVKRPLRDLKVGPFYGCYIIRPTDRLGIDDELPRDRYLHMVIEALGGTVIQYAGQHKCCGFPIITMNKDASLRQAGRHIGDAIDAEADCLVTPCPLCHLNLDLQQPLAERTVGRDLGLPILHLPQLVGLALGPDAQGARPGAPRRQADRGRRLVEAVVAGVPTAGGQTVSAARSAPAGSARPARRAL
jgi:succinate dehydrogenase / fumarate reductase cytochrome b subunit